MKKLLLSIVSLFFVLNFLSAQNNISIDINDPVYGILRSAETQNLCSPLSTSKPFTKKYIISKLEEIHLNLEDLEDDQSLEIIEYYLNKYEYEQGQHVKEGYIKIENKDVDYPASFIIYNTFELNLGTGLYKNNSQNSTGFEGYSRFGFMGDLGENLSYNCTAFLGLTKMPLEELGDDYNVGSWLYNIHYDNENNPIVQSPRTIKTYRNNSFLPYKYSKYWDGSCYYLSNISGDGLKTWAFNTALAFAMNGEIHASFHENTIELGIARQRREWGAMDTDSSLVLNSQARPFLAAEAVFAPFDFLSLATLTGALEMPNQDHINDGAWYLTDGDGVKTGDWEDGMFFQNAFSMIMVNLELEHLHFDFGSTVIWPKRFELGYAFPLIDNVVYQNDIGDNDNLALFTDIKFKLPQIGSIWFSGYLDEIISPTTKFWRKVRAMFAFQAGAKVNVPILPFTTASFRYTKVEPYCYTHNSVNYTPWYRQYISLSYTNNGECLGYYLAPNSDEFNFQLEANPSPYLNFGFQYQLIRHGVDWGSGSIIGCNLYSELRNTGRDELDKYFLRDGTYEWSNIISLHGSYNLRQFDIPVTINAGLGYIYDWFTAIDGEPGKNTSYSIINNDEYSEKHGIVLNLGVSILFE